MTAIQFRSDFDVQLLDVMGTDHRIVQAAKVSTAGADSINAEDSAGLIGYLMSNRHGSPFEHCVMQWMITAPIFVWREFHRHRIASYNEESSRYRRLSPVFYVADSAVRPTRQVGKPGHYMLETAEEDLGWWFSDQLTGHLEDAYRGYEEALKNGIAREVARQVLPVSIYSTCYVTMNVRALMNFLSLRNAPTALWEIRQVAALMEAHFAGEFPAVHGAFQAAGRVAP